MENVKLIKKLLNYPKDADVVIGQGQADNAPVIIVVIDAFNDEENDEIDLGSL